MKVWLACFLVLFALAEVFNWVGNFTLPLPIYILGGALLAVASNYDKIIGSYFSDITSEISPEPLQLDSSTQSSRSISFTIARPVENAQQSEID
ncbi:hypothetical protein [Cylindrospermum sp. FACHB-282]|uniref:hypothetical protein n=1 Tax=Cylindrospermum sp. FACHB-282 TaxID=2692794 RepID=UPI00168378AA|nr:hypothetical protein [Cylindrospermum sp. FACHB-282]MBD2387027.1 hypothetical protein [Cylindrospermum sp. FACHB-282]